MTTVRDVVSVMECIARPQWAEEWDKIGLLSGSAGQPVRRIALALDATLPALSAAAKKKADMLIVHHPAFFAAPTTLADTVPLGVRAAAMARSGIAVYAAHTNLDAAPGGTNDALAALAGLQFPDIIQTTCVERLLKLAVFVPAGHEEDMIRALGEAGAGAIGNYSCCTFRTQGTGTFRCGPGTKPYKGRPGSFEQADEFRIETVFGEYSRDQVLAAMLAVHPYEEPAYDIYALEDGARRFGHGRVGMLDEPQTVHALARRMAQATGSTMTQYTGTGKRRVERAAVWCGAGVKAKVFAGCGAEVVIAGEVGYHELEDFIQQGMDVITLGHGFSETLVLPPLAARLRKALPGVAVSLLTGTGYAMNNV